MAASSTELFAPAAADADASSWAVRNGALLGYAAAALALLAGWAINRNAELVNPEHGIGYWLGIVGASLMGILLLYPVRKRVRFMRFFGATRHWFRLHMILGVLGPVLILYHCNFTPGSLNSNVALICTLLVAASGILGRYLYTKVHVDLDGHKATLRELGEKARLTAAQQMRTAVLVPQLIERMTAFDSLVLTPPASFAATVALPFRLALQTRWESLRLTWFARRQLKAQARKSAVIAAQRKRLERVVNGFIQEHLRRVRRVAEFGSYERLFALWHVFHLPFFYMLVITALIHVLAVHMY
ncbi:MAG TPA: hypothetical protein VIC71_11460 [Gammaproteobacteria bacterium]|jgi:hypothetical protein